MKTVFPGGLAILVCVGSSIAAQTRPVPGRATLETRIGAVDGPGALGQIEAIVVDGVGQVYALESDEGRVLVFDPAGNPVRTLGRPGGGPGELRSPVGMAFTPERQLWIIDPGNNRITIYDEDGQHVGDRRLASGFELAPWPGRIDRDGNLYHYAPDPMAGEFAYVMVKYDRSLTPVDTLRPPVPPQPPEFFETSTRRWGNLRARVPFTPRLVWRLSPTGGMWWAWTEDYQVFDRPGAGQPRIEQNARSALVTTEEREAALERLQRFAELGGRIDRSRIPSRKPLIRDFGFDDAGGVWVMPELPDGQTGRRLDRFDMMGRYLGRVDLPVILSSSPAPVIHGNRIYAVERDELGVPYLVVLRMLR